jgi:hypothetical protein
LLVGTDVAAPKAGFSDKEMRQHWNLQRFPFMAR